MSPSPEICVRTSKLALWYGDFQALKEIDL